MKRYNNGIEWEIVHEDDGWYSIYRVRDGQKIFKIQAKDMEHVEKYIELTEDCPIPLKRF